MDHTPLILIIDDEPSFLEIFSKKLEAAGFRTAVAGNGKDGIAQVKALRPNLVLLDMQMPHQTGADVLSELKSDLSIRQIPVVFLSSIGSPDPRSAATNESFSREIGAVGYIHKTDELDSIIEKVRQILG